MARKYTPEQRKADVSRALKYRAANREKVNAYRRSYAKANPEKIHGYNQRFYYKNHKKHLAYHADYRAAIKKEVIEAYGDQCSCCGEVDHAFLTVEHVHGYKTRPDLYAHIPRGGIHLYLWLKAHGFPKGNFSTLCFNCNLGKAHSKDGRCPHEKAMRNLFLVEGAA